MAHHPARWLAPLALLAGLAGCTADGASAPGALTDPAVPAAPGAQPAPANAGTTPAATGSRLQPGMWEATVANGFKGDKITFRVAADGVTIQDVVFTGNWRCSGSTKIMDVPHVPGSFTVTAGAFSEVKREPYLAWTFEGRFTSATEATGTFRSEYDTDCDTYKLNWTARPI
ncbi:hypothetical protein D3C72_799640 [compost metagenome]